MTINEIQKVLVKFPRKKDEIFACFPFLIALSESLPKAEINIVVEEGCMPAFSFLPFKVRVFQRPRLKTNLPGTHQFCANLIDIFNIDVYFDLEGSFNSAFMGFNFRAKERVGYEEGWNKYLLNRKYPAMPSLDLESRSLLLLEKFLNQQYNDLKIYVRKDSSKPDDKLEALFAAPEAPKFILVMLNDFHSVVKEVEIWKQFFDCFENQNFIVYAETNQNAISEILHKMDTKNKLYMHYGEDYQVLKYLLSKVSGVVTNNLWAEGLSSFYGVDVVSLLEKAEAYPVYQYFRYKPNRVFHDKKKLEIFRNALGEDKNIVEVNQLVDEMHLLFKL